MSRSKYLSVILLVAAAGCFVAFLNHSFSAQSALDAGDLKSLVQSQASEIIANRWGVAAILLAAVSVRSWQKTDE